MFHKPLRAALLGVCLSPMTAVAQPAAPAVQFDQALSQYRQMIDRSIQYLRVRGQARDGSFSGQAGVGPTALVVSGLLAVGVAPEDPMIKQAFEFLDANIQPDGGIYAPQSRHRNYETCIAIMAYHQANRDGRLDSVLAGAEKFVRGIQWDEDEGIQPSNMAYGGGGYDSQSRPDLSNTSFLIESLTSLGRGPDDEAIQKALIFVSRCQNLESQYNDSPHAAKVNDGGFFYTVAGGGESKAEPLPDGGLRSYGSMSYAGLKSMIYAGLTADDPRVRAATEFLRKNYDVDSNPGMGQQGLFYYYQTMAKALAAVGQDVLTDDRGHQHDWKSQLRSKLYSLQAKDGSWVNPTSRWMEGDPNLVTAYALLTLAQCPPAGK
ncbi:MAG: terpene cyclase/mutase family protein [Pirellulaceae bacterium]|nr:terpene cyclase/mutase family protein [Pirellulaceae bacterium]